MASVLRIAKGHINGSWLLAVSSWQLPTLVNDFDDSAQRSVRDDALRARLDRFNKSRLLAVPSAERSQSECLTNPKHIVTVAHFLLVVVGIELCFLQLQLLLELTVEIQRLAGVEVDADTVQLTLEVDTMVVLDIIGVGRIATSRNRFDIVVLLVLFQLLIFGVAQYHFGKDASRIGTRFAFVHQRNGVLLLLFFVKIGQKAELVEGLVLIEVVQLTGYLLSVQGDQSRLYLTIRGQINNNRYIRASDVHGIADADGNRAAG